MSGLWRVRYAVAADVERLVDLAAERRERYRRYQPEFWRPADDAADKQRQFFLNLVDDHGVAVLVAAVGGDVRGFAVARIVQAPPVYDPGGLTCMVDDFTVRDDAEWPEIGPLLIEAIAHWAADGGATQMVVVTAHLDEAKRGALGGSDLSLASEWWVRPTADTSRPVS